MIVEETKPTSDIIGLKSVAREIENSFVRLAEQETASKMTLNLIEKLTINFDNINKQLVVIDKRYAILNERIDKISNDLNELVNG
jgi:hypothetical protein